MSPVFQPNFSTTAIGSLPFADGDEAAAFALEAGLSIPFWPQTPKRCFAEGMIPQYSEGMPCLRVDGASERIWFDPTDKPAELEAFYEKFLQEDPSLFAISPAMSAGFPAFKRLAAGRTWPYVKGQTTGPITFCTGVYNQDREPIYSDPDLRDASIKTLARKVEWQVGQLRPFATEGVVIFVDEPSLAAYGSSAYIYLSEEKVYEMLGEVFEAIVAAGAIPGVHVCGNCDWGMLARSGVRIINFDAYRYGSTIALYPDQIRQFLEGGGCIAWGLVPTDDAVREETAESLVRRLDSYLQVLDGKAVPRELVRQRSMLTPSCGTGTMTPDDARSVFRLLGEVRGKCLSEMT